MNIFFLSADPAKAARWHNDAHVGKMCLEACQMMADRCHHMGFDPGVGRLGKGHQSHPMTLWVGENKANYDWTWHLALELDAEHQRRYGTNAPWAAHLPMLSVGKHSMPDGEFTNPPRCIYDWCKYDYDWHQKFGDKVPCHVASYRLYYAAKYWEAEPMAHAEESSPARTAARRMRSWKHRGEPGWMRKALSALPDRLAA